MLGEAESSWDYVVERVSIQAARNSTNQTPVKCFLLLKIFSKFRNVKAVLVKSYVNGQE
jgi:hypothetical protein